MSEYAQKRDSAEAHGQSGYTLIEIVVVIIVIGILSLVTARAYPAARGNQALRLAEQQIQSVLREAQQKAINEERDPDCVAAATDGDAGTLPDFQQQCSDVGVWISGTELVMFADTDLGPDGELGGDEQYTDGDDIVLKRLPLPNGVLVLSDATTNESFVFKGVPPAIELFIDGQPFAGPGEILLEATNASARLDIEAHGQVLRNGA